MCLSTLKCLYQVLMFLGLMLWNKLSRMLKCFPYKVYIFSKISSLKLMLIVMVIVMMSLGFLVSIGWHYVDDFYKIHNHTMWISWDHWILFVRNVVDYVAKTSNIVYFFFSFVRDVLIFSLNFIKMADLYLCHHR